MGGGSEKYSQKNTALLSEKYTLDNRMNAVYKMESTIIVNEFPLLTLALHMARRAGPSAKAIQMFLSKFANSLTEGPQKLKRLSLSY